MNIYRYAWKSFRRQMGKGILFMIILAVTLMTGVMNIASSLQQLVYDQSITLSGNGHASYRGITQEQADLLMGREEVEWGELRLALRAHYGIAEGGEVGLYYSSALDRMEGFELTSGAMPEKDNEAVLYPHTAELIGVPAKPGQAFSMKIALPDGTSVTEDFVISGVIRAQKMVEAQEMNFLLLPEAFIQKYGQFPETYGTPENELLDSRQLTLRFRDGYPVEETAAALAQAAGIREKDFHINYDYLLLQNPSSDFLEMAGIVLLVLLLTGILVIHNAFGIAIVRRTHQYGLLTLIGASKKQVRRCVYLDALLCAACALPVGMALGTAVGYASIPVIRGIIQDPSFSPALWPWTYGLTAALTLLMVLLGTVRPARKAASVTPVEAVKFTYTPKIRKRKTEQENITLPVLARLNLYRARDRTVGTILALTVSGVLLLSVSTVGLTMYHSTEELTRGQVAGDVQIITGRQEGRSLYHPMKNQLTEDMLRKIGEIDGVEQVHAIQRQSYYREAFTDEESWAYAEMGTIASMDERLLETLVDAETLEALKQPGTAIAVPYDGGGTARERYAAGQEVSGFFVKPEDEIDVPYKNVLTGFTVKVIIEMGHGTFPDYSNSFFTELPELIMLRDSYALLGCNSTYYSASLDIDREKYDTITQELDSLFAPYEELDYQTHQKLIQEYKRQMAGLFSLVFTGLAIIVLISFMNLSSSVLIGIQHRQKEFGVLMALGLSKRGLRKLLREESLYISLISTAASVALGLSIGYLLYHLIYQMGADYMLYRFPVVPLLIFLVVYTVVPLLVTGFAVWQMKRKTTVDLLGQIS